MFDIDLIQRKIKQFIVNYFGVRKNMLSGDIGDGFINRANHINLQSKCEYINGMMNNIVVHYDVQLIMTTAILMIGVAVSSVIWWMFYPLIYSTSSVENDILEFRGASTHDINSMMSNYTIKDYVKTLKILAPEKDIKELEKAMYKIKNDAERHLKGE